MPPNGPASSPQPCNSPAKNRRHQHGLTLREIGQIHGRASRDEKQEEGDYRDASGKVAKYRVYMLHELRIGPLVACTGRRYARSHAPDDRQRNRKANLGISNPHKPTAAQGRPFADRNLLVALARAAAGAMLFGLPLFMTMEMWRLGFTIEPARLALYVLVSLPLLAGLAYIAGFRDDADWFDAAVDGLVAWLVGAVTGAAVLGLLGALTPEMSLAELPARSPWSRCRRASVRHWRAASSASARRRRRRHPGRAMAASCS